MNKSHALTWLLFAGTATIAALLFPAFLIYSQIAPALGLDIKNVLNELSNNILFKLIFFIVIGSVIYHGFYRFKAILQEQAPSHEGIIEIMMIALAIIFVLLALAVVILL
ncbi:MAG TPA: hypothetical protein VKU94_02995 [Geobacterales bacterium]|nr:hypothetical protein [Geobacterales bacterium]